MSVAVLTRCMNEPYLNEFVSYYLHEGVDMIYILLDIKTSDGQIDSIEGHPKIKIQKNYEYSNRLELRELFNGELLNYRWLINCDVDEYISTRHNSENSIKDELNANFADADMIYIPWVMMSFNGLKKNPMKLLETNVYRANYNNKKGKHFNNKHSKVANYKIVTKGKSIFNPNSYIISNAHLPIENINRNNIEYNGLTGELMKKREKGIMKLNEDKIKNAFFICYHFRIVSIEHLQMKMSGQYSVNSYKQNQKTLINIDSPQLKDLTLYNKSIKRDNPFKPIILKQSTENNNKNMKKTTNHKSKK